MKLPKYYAPLLPGPPPPLCQKAGQRMSRQKRKDNFSADLKETIENLFLRFRYLTEIKKRWFSSLFDIFLWTINNQFENQIKPPNNVGGLPCYLCHWETLKPILTFQSVHSQAMKQSALSNVCNNTFCTVIQQICTHCESLSSHFVNCNIY